MAIMRRARTAVLFSALALHSACDSTTGPDGVAPSSGGTFQRVIGSPGTWESGQFVRSTSYGYLILQTQGYFGQHTVVVKTDVRGETISSNTLRSQDSRSLIDAVATRDGGAAASSPRTRSSSTSSKSRVQSNGAARWSNGMACGPKRSPRCPTEGLPSLAALEISSRPRHFD